METTVNNTLQVFTNEELNANIRVVEIDGQPFFVAKDVCESFGDTNYRRSVARLDDDEKSISSIDTLGGKQQMSVVNEAGLYTLLFYMQPQKAKGVSQNDTLIDERIAKLKQFKRWITHDVLPSIRKHGKYELPKIAPHPRCKTRLIGTAIKDIGLTARMIQEVFHVREGLALSKATVLIEMTYGVDLEPVKELLPPAEHDVGSLTPTQLAKMIGDTTNRAVNKALVELGFQVKTDKGYELTDAGKEYGEMVPFTSKNSKHTGYQPKWNTKVIAEIKNVTV